MLLFYNTLKPHNGRKFEILKPFLETTTENSTEKFNPIGEGCRLDTDNHGDCRISPACIL